MTTQEGAQASSDAPAGRQLHDQAYFLDLLGDSHNGLGRHEAAIEAYRQAAEAYRSAEAHCSYALCLLKVAGSHLSLGEPWQPSQITPSQEGVNLIATVDQTDQAQFFRLHLLPSPAFQLSGCTASHDSSVTLWDANQHTRLASLVGHTGWIRGALFSPNGRLLATADTDQTLIIWDVQRRTRTWRRQ